MPGLAIFLSPWTADGLDKDFGFWNSGYPGLRGQRSGDMAGQAIFLCPWTAEGLDKDYGFQNSGYPGFGG